MTTYRDYARRIISQHLNSFVAQKAGVRFVKDIEYIHRMRVAYRRLRTALEIFEDVFSKKEIKRWGKYIRQAAKILGKARDLDTQIDFLKKFERRLKHPAYRKGIRKLWELLAQKRADDQSDVIRALRTLEKSKVCEEMKIALQNLSADSKVESPDKIIRRAKSTIAHQLKNLFQHEASVFKPQHTESLHRMRIAEKHLRYTLEAFEPAYKNELGPFIEKIIVIQRLLGEMHDFDTWGEALPHQIAPKDQSNKAVSFAVGFFKNKCRRHSAQRFRAFVAFWKKLKRERFWERLDAVLKAG